MATDKESGEEKAFARAKSTLSGFARTSAAQEIARNDDALNLRRPFVDLQQLRVAHQLLDRVTPFM